MDQEQEREGESYPVGAVIAVFFDSVEKGVDDEKEVVLAIELPRLLVCDDSDGVGDAIEDGVA